MVMSADLAGFTIGVTADRRADEQADLLRRRGAEVRHAAAMTSRPLLSAEAPAGAIDALTFTSPPAVQHLAALADAHGLGGPLRDPANGIVMACVGPVTAEAALAAGLPSIVFPTPGRMGLMIRTLADALALRCREIVVDTTPTRMQGRLVEVGEAQATLSRVERAVFEVLADRGGSVVAVPEILES